MSRITAMANRLIDAKRHKQGISIIVPLLNEEKNICRLLASLAELGNEDEILLIDGGSSDHTLAYAKEFITAKEHKGPSFRLLHNPEKLQAQALNLGLQAATNSTCLRLDGHLQIAPGCDLQKEIDNLLMLLETGQSYCAIGFKQRFMGNSVIDSAVTLIAATPFLSGFSCYRYATKPCPTWNTAWLFCLNKRLAQEIGGFACHATPNEDQHFNKRLIAHTRKPILIYPQLPLYYHPRSTLLGLTRQYFNYGQARSRTYLLGEQGKRGQWRTSTSGALHLLITLAYAGAILSAPAIYGAILTFILCCNLHAIASDKLNFFRNGDLQKPHPLVLVIALLLSPLVAVVPSLARSSGALWQLISPIQR